MKGFRYLIPARAELHSAARYYRERSPRVAASFMQAVDEAIQHLLQFPESAPFIREPLRGKVVQRFPYTLIYSIEDDTILIVAVAHQSRRPEYWRNEGKPPSVGHDLEGKRLGVGPAPRPEISRTYART